MQHLLQRHLGALEPPALEDLDELADALLVGAGGAAHVEVVAHHHDVAAVERARGDDVLDVLVVEELADGRLDLILLAVTGISAGVGDNGAAARDDRGILHEARVRVLLQCRQLGYFHAALLQGGDVVVVLLHGALVDGLAQLRGARDAVAQRLARLADDDVGELGHRDSLSSLARFRVRTV